MGNETKNRQQICFKQLKKMTLHTLKNGHQIYLNHNLKAVLDSLIYNSKNDWDFVIIVTGDGMVRTGKSVLAMNVSAYIADKLNTPFSIDNIYFDSQDMISAAQVAPPNSVFQYDEAREGLASAKRFSKVQQDLIDFFNECGQLNHIFVLVLPDFFSLNWELATNRSELLLNVFRTENNTMRHLKGETERVPVTVFERGSFELFNRKAKAKLYWTSKRCGLRQYNLVKAAGPMNFTNNYPIDETAYRLKKREALGRFDARHKVEVEKKIVYKENLINLVKELKKKGFTYTALGELIGKDKSYFSKLAEGGTFECENGKMTIKTHQNEENLEKEEVDETY